MIPAEAVEAECTCYPTDPKYWFVHYGAVEPGSAIEPNPDCLKHFPRKAESEPSQPLKEYNWGAL